jgi:hypothetical protein
MGEGVLDVTAFCEIRNRKVNPSWRTEIGKAGVRITPEPQPTLARGFKAMNQER